MSVRLLVAGSPTWRDGDGIRYGLRWALDRYGHDGSTLITAGEPTRGATAIAARAWAEIPGVNPNIETISGWLGGGSKGVEGAALETNLRAAEPQVTLIFTLPGHQRGKLPRRVTALSRQVGIPTWRWSITLKRIVEAGVDHHDGRFRRHHPADTSYDV